MKIEHALLVTVIAQIVCYLIGYNSGFNNGHDNALKYEDACKQKACSCTLEP